jgi:hypothetical protein
MKPDDSSLQTFELAAVERQARDLLNRASAWDRFPTPVDDMLEAAKLRVAPKGLFLFTGVGPGSTWREVQRRVASTRSTITPD